MKGHLSGAFLLPRIRPLKVTRYIITRSLFWVEFLQHYYYFINTRFANQILYFILLINSYYVFLYCLGGWDQYSWRQMYFLKMLRIHTKNHLAYFRWRSHKVLWYHLSIEHQLWDRASNPSSHTVFVIQYMTLFAKIQRKVSVFQKRLVDKHCRKNVLIVIYNIIKRSGVAFILHNVFNVSCKLTS